MTQLTMFDPEEGLGRNLKFERWLLQGVSEGWISEPYCAVHGDLPLNDEERTVLDDFDGDLDALCINVVRLWSR